MGTNSDNSKMSAYILMQAKREVGVQICFALAAFENITKKGEGDIIIAFSSIHSFLTHCANVGKLLWSTEIRTETGQDLATHLGTTGLSLLKDRSFRNDLDHYDERLVCWIKAEYPKHENGDADRRPISDLTIGDKDLKGGRNALHLRHYDPHTKNYTYGDRNLDLEALRNELIAIRQLRGIGPTDVVQG